MSNEEAVQVLEIVQYIVHALLKFNSNEYIIHWLKKIIDVLITDTPGDISKLQNEQKCFFLKKILEIFTPERKEISSSLVDSIFEQGIRFLET
jgi:hypothetical protein